jgi:hypothetical protein
LNEGRVATLAGHIRGQQEVNVESAGSPVILKRRYAIEYRFGA